MLQCWKCHKIISEEPIKIGFRTYCPYCDVDQHVCLHCRHHAPEKHNECNVPGTDWIKDRQVRNYCEDFDIKPIINSKETNLPKKGIDSLFKDD
jgi:hypothetical protein